MAKNPRALTNPTPLAVCLSELVGRLEPNPGDLLIISSALDQYPLFHGSECLELFKQPALLRKASLSFHVERVSFRLFDPSFLATASPLQPTGVYKGPAMHPYPLISGKYVAALYTFVYLCLRLPCSAIPKRVGSRFHNDCLHASITVMGQTLEASTMWSRSLRGTSKSETVPKGEVSFCGPTIQELRFEKPSDLSDLWRAISCKRALVICRGLDWKEAPKRKFAGFKAVGICL